MDERITSLEVRVGGIEEGIRHIVSKLDSRDKMPWGALIGTAGFIVTLVGAVGGMAFTPLNSGISDLKSVMVKFENKSDGFMKREDIEAQIKALRDAFREQFDIGKERRNDLQAKTDERIARSEKDIAAVQAQVVPRGEHQETWAGQRVKDEALQRQIDELRANLASLNTPRDTIQAMLRRIDELDAALRLRR